MAKVELQHEGEAGETEVPHLIAEDVDGDWGSALGQTMGWATTEGAGSGEGRRRFPTVLLRPDGHVHSFVHSTTKGGAGSSFYSQEEETEEEAELAFQR